MAINSVFHPLPPFQWDVKKCQSITGLPKLLWYIIKWQGHAIEAKLSGQEKVT